MPNIQQRIEATASAASPSLSRVGHWIAAHLIQTLSCSAEEIAASTGTSVAAINRFSCAAGFDGFAHLKASLGRELESVIDPVRKLSDAKSGSRRASEGIGPDTLRQAVSVSEVRKAAGRLMKARNVWAFGLGTSSFMASYAAHLFMPFLAHVGAVTGIGGTEMAARQLARCGPGDVMLALSLPRYSTDAPKLAAFARERGVHVIAVTDSPRAPLARVANTLLLVPAEHPLLPSSAQGALALIEALAGEVMRLNPDAVEIAKEVSQALLQHLATDDPSFNLEPPESP